MAQLIVRDLEEHVKERLRRRARQNGRSMEEEARDILRKAILTKPGPTEEGAGTQIAKLFSGLGMDFDIPELRGYEVRPVKFEE
jgi:plasmid stability protein